MKDISSIFLSKISSIILKILSETLEIIINFSLSKKDLFSNSSLKFSELLIISLSS